MRLRAGAGLGGAMTILLAATLLGAPPDAAAKGRRGGSSSSSSARPAAKADHEHAGPNIHITVRPNVAGPASPLRAVGGEDEPTTERVPQPPRAAAPDPEDQARRSAALASHERAMAERAAARKEEAERAEILRLEAERIEARRAAQRQAEENAEAARRAAAQEQEKRAQAAVSADVEQVLERARADHPVLRTPEGEPILRSILARQKVLQARGLYPSVAMVEAVADHSEALRPRPRALAEAPAPAPAADHSKSFGNCRWVTPYHWSCQ